MNRELYFNYIEGKLNVLSKKIETRGKLNLLDSHIHSENFFLYFFNLLYSYELQNLNSKSPNTEAIDLIDNANKIVVQVSATCTKQKVESALSKSILSQYTNYTFKFISIAKDASELRKKTFNNPHKLSFNPSTDIYDIISLLNDISGEEIEKIEKIYNFVKKELGGETDVIKLDSNLAAIINILSKEKWDDANKAETGNSFVIEQKITYNQLQDAKELIEEYRLFYGKVDNIYSEFDAMGVNKSNSVLATIKREYLKFKDFKSADEVFYFVIAEIKNKVLESPNFTKIPIEELDLCIDILVVDAFIRCKIFEKPHECI